MVKVSSENSEMVTGPIALGRYVGVVESVVVTEYVSYGSGNRIEI